MPERPETVERRAWRRIGEELGVDTTGEAWKNGTTAIKLPDFMRSLLEDTRISIGARSLARTVGQSLSWVKRGIEIASSDQDIIVLKEDGTEAYRITNAQVRESFGMRPQDRF